MIGFRASPSEAITSYRAAAATEFEILERRDNVMVLRSQGHSLCQIGEKLGVSPETVKADLKFLLAEWQRKAAPHRAVWMAEMIADLYPRNVQG